MRYGDERRETRLTRRFRDEDRLAHSIDTQSRGSTAFRAETPDSLQLQTTRERHQSIEAARRTSKPGEAAGQAAAAEKVAELLLDESGQPFPVTQTGSLRAERLEVIADHLVQHALRGIPRLIGR